MSAVLMQDRKRKSTESVRRCKSLVYQASATRPPFNEPTFSRIPSHSEPRTVVEMFGRRVSAEPSVHRLSLDLARPANAYAQCVR
jgi:hypothetical protein